jgi:hypothetical protein
LAPRPKCWHTLDASRSEALLAVDLYNRSVAERSLEGFVMHMHVAWLYLMHAKFLRDNIDFRYREAGGRRLAKIDGEVKTWELSRCLKEAFPDERDSVRANVEFFILIRNKIEHRFEQLLATAIAGKVQALVMNYEECLVGWFGSGASLADSLRFPVFVSSLTPDAVAALKTIHRKLPKRVTDFIREHDASLPSEITDDWRYDFRVLLLPQTGPKSETDVVMRFIREDEMTPEERAARDVVQTIVCNKTVAVQNRGRHRPSAVSLAVSKQLGAKFSVHGHTAAWRYYRVRPAEGADKPELTDDRHCVWDEPHRDYLYTDAWIRKLVKDLANAETFKEVTGRAPIPLTA